MTPPGRLFALVLSLAATLGAVAAAPSDGPGSDFEARLARLRSMPRERRLRLAEELKAFDALGPTERARIRELDRRLAELPEEDRHRYERLMHAYHVWLERLPEARRRQVEEAAPQDRIALVTKFRAEQGKERAKRAARSNRDPIQVSSLVSEPLMISAIETRYWYSLPLQARNEILKIPGPARQKAEFRKRSKADPAVARLNRDLSERLGADMPNERIDLEKVLERHLANPNAKTPPMPEVLKRVEMRFLRKRGEPEPVTPARLARFEASMPPWVRESMDLLPPDAAARRLKVLYRMVFPPGEEIAEPAPPKKDAPAKGRPTPPPPTTPRDF